MFRRFLMLMVCLSVALVSSCAEMENANSSEESIRPENSGSSEGIMLPENIHGYVLVTVGTQSGWLPLPEEGEYDFPVVQTLPDGSTMQNILHLTPEGVVMASATCDNQDCVDQGEVTQANREERILSNMIICLPNQVLVELLTPEEMQALLVVTPAAEPAE